MPDDRTRSADAKVVITGQIPSDTNRVKVYLRSMQPTFLETAHQPPVSPNFHGSQEPKTYSARTANKTISFPSLLTAIRASRPRWNKGLDRQETSERKNLTIVFVLARSPSVLPRSGLSSLGISALTPGHT